MSEKHYIRKSGGEWRQINPELYDISYKWHKDDDIKSWYLQMSANVILKGLDFDFCKQYETLTDECKVMDYKIERDDVLEFEGYLNLRGEYQNNGKILITKIVDIEKFDCIFKSEEINLFDLSPSRYSCRPYLGSLEFAEYLISYGPHGTYHKGDIKSESLNWVLYYKEIGHGINSSGDDYKFEQYKWVREVYYGGYTNPPGEGWIQVGTNKWVRKVSVTKEEVQIINTSIAVGDTNHSVLETWTYLPPTQLTNGIRLTDVLKKIIEDCGYTFTSQFFKDTPTITNSIYEVVESLFHNILLFHISDVIYVDEPGNATNMKVTKGDFIKEVLNYFNLEMWKNENAIYLEHKSYKDRVTDLDITQSKYYENKYKYKTDIAKYEEWVHTEGSKNDNFKSIKLEYSKNCVKELKRAELSESFSLLFTDLTSVISNKALWENDDIGKATIVMISVDSAGVINRNDTLYASNLMNGCLSFAYLINHLYNYVRSEKTGSVGGMKILNNITGSGKQNSIRFPTTIENFISLSPYNFIKVGDTIALKNSLEWENSICTIDYELI